MTQKFTITERTHGDRDPGSVTTFLRKYNQGRKRGEVSTPCNGCTACCRDSEFFIELTDGEADRYPEKHRPEDGGKWRLNRKASGECVHFIEDRCSIRETRPHGCRTYDCRLHMLGAPIGDDTPLVEEASRQWRMFSAPTREDKIVYVAFKMLMYDTFIMGRRMRTEWEEYRDDAIRMVDHIEANSDEPDAVMRAGIVRGDQP
jgi:Fe-S-cluster containining protein